MDEEIGMYYLQSRYYDPVVGRFINADNVELVESAGMIYNSTLFTYVSNNPVNNMDESGNFSLNSVFKFLGDIFSKITSRIKDFFNSLFKVKDGKLYISTAVIAATIDTIISIFIAKWLSGTIKGLLKALAKMYFKKGNKKGVDIAKKVLKWFATDKMGKKVAKGLLHVLVSIALGFVGLKKPVRTAISSIVDSCIQSVLTFENKLATKIASLVSAFSSVGGFIAFFLDLSDYNWDDYWTPANNARLILGTQVVKLR